MRIYLKKMMQFTALNVVRHITENVIILSVTVVCKNFTVQPKTETEEQTQETSQENVNTDETVCRMCGETYPQNDAGCPKCGAPNMSKMGGKFVVFDFLGGVPADMDLGDGVTADEAKMFVNSIRLHISEPTVL